MEYLKAADSPVCSGNNTKITILWDSLGKQFLHTILSNHNWPIHSTHSLLTSKCCEGGKHFGTGTHDHNDIATRKWTKCNLLVMCSPYGVHTETVKIALRHKQTVLKFYPFCCNFQNVQWLFIKPVSDVSCLDCSRFAETNVENPVNMGITEISVIEELVHLPNPLEIRELHP